MIKRSSINKLSLRNFMKSRRSKREKKKSSNKIRLGKFLIFLPYNVDCSLQKIE